MSYRLMPLSGKYGLGKSTIVDADRFDEFSRWSWYFSEGLYVRRSCLIDGRHVKFSLHREVAEAQPGEHVDHRDGNPLNNTHENLRICSNRENHRNIVSSYNQKKGGFKGVTWNKHSGKWQAQIRAGRIMPCGRCNYIYLGLFIDPVAAALAYDRAAAQHFGEFAALNFPEKAANLGRETA